MYTRRPWASWVALIVIGAVLERRALKMPTSNSTLSAVTRTVFQTHRIEGRIAFLLFWGALTAWFVPHIVRGKNFEGDEKLP